MVGLNWFNEHQNRFNSIPTIQKIKKKKGRLESDYVSVRLKRIGKAVPTSAIAAAPANR